MNRKIFIGIITVIFLIVGGMVVIFHPKSMSHNDLRIMLNGDTIMNIDEVYEEPGYQAIDAIDGDITSQVKVDENINYHVAGTYEIVYSVTNSKGETARVSRFVILDKVLSYIYKEEYNAINNAAKSWWSANKKNQTRPSGGYSYGLLKQYNATFIGPDEKVIYLTFDEGGNQTYVNEIVDVLNQNDVKATFFLCRGFMLKNPELIRKIEATGHSVGNHTTHHLKMSELATKENFAQYVSEITDLEKAYFEITGKIMDKVYREPKGEWSERSLAIVKDMGYKSFFYSADYLDWNGDVTGDYAYNELMKRYHNGAIYLIHPQNKGNYEAMDRFIKEMKRLGYTFGLVRDITID